MPKYDSLLKSPQSIQEKWGLSANEAQKVYELWDLAYDEVQSDSPAIVPLMKDVETYLSQKPALFGNPDKKFTRVKGKMSSAERARLMNTHGVQLLMRTISIGPDDKRRMFSTIWSGLKGKEKGDVEAAKRTAKKFNDVYAADEFVNYLQHIAGETEDFRVQKPYVAPAGRDAFYLYVWYKS